MGKGVVNVFGQDNISLRLGQGLSIGREDKLKGVIEVFYNDPYGAGEIIEETKGLLVFKAKKSGTLRITIIPDADVDRAKIIVVNIVN